MLHAITLDRRRPKSPCTRPLPSPQTAPRTYVPPRQRLSESYDECLRLDRELKIIENSGHAKLGVFAKPLGDQQRCRMMAAAAKQDAAHHLPDDPVAEPAFVDDDDVTTDPFFHSFYDDAGRSTYEQLLRTRMRVLALAKIVYGRQSVAYVRAEVEIAESYARMNLWKQAYTHVVVAYSILKEMDATRAVQQRETIQSLQETGESDTLENDTFGRLLEFFYDQQLHGERVGGITKVELAKEASQWGPTIGRHPIHESSGITAIVAPSNLDMLFDAAPFLHWQQLLLRMERQSAMFQDHVRLAELCIPEPTRSTLRHTFSQLDPTRLSVVPLQSLLDSLEDLALHDDDLVRVCEALRTHDARIVYPSITWSEVVQLASTSLFPPPERTTSLANPHDSARDLRPRLKFLSGRFFLRKGQLDDAMRSMQTAIAEEEQVHGCDSASLVLLYLTMAETLSVRFKQLAVVAQQNAFTIADNWLKTTDGSRRLRAKALEVIELASRQHTASLPTKKDAEAQAREELLKEYAVLSLVRPDATAVEDAIEFCTKAWRIQELTHGRDHITTASVHVTLAQIHAIRQDYDHAVQCYEQAIAIYEAACNGPVPASMWLTHAIAKLYHHHMHRLAEAATLYDRVGAFFHSFALEFASSDSTRRESCTQAIETWRQWLAVASMGAGFQSSLEDEKRIRTKIHDATVDGFGEFAIEAADSGHELAQRLVKMGQLKQAERYLRTAWYVLESHFGPNDRRSRKARKELGTLSAEIKGAALDDDEDGGHDWLSL